MSRPSASPTVASSAPAPTRDATAVTRSSPPGTDAGSPAPAGPGPQQPPPPRLPTRRGSRRSTHLWYRTYVRYHTGGRRHKLDQPGTPPTAGPRRVHGAGPAGTARRNRRADGDGNPQEPPHPFDPPPLRQGRHERGDVVLVVVR